MILSAPDIERVKKIIKPFSEKQLGPASYDLRLGDQYLKWIDLIPGRFVNPFKEEMGDYFMDAIATGFHFLRKGETVKIYSLEEIKLPAHLLGMVAPRGSARKLDIDVSHSILSPGYSGPVLLEISNLSPMNYSLPIGSSVAQLILFELKSKTDRPYTGRYQDLFRLTANPIDMQGEGFEPS